MFSFRRDTPVVSISHASGVRADGERTVLSPGAVGTDEVMQAFETFRQAVRDGEAALAALCEPIVPRVAGEGFQAPSRSRRIHSTPSLTSGERRAHCALCSMFAVRF